MVGGQLVRTFRKLPAWHLSGLQPRSPVLQRVDIWLYYERTGHGKQTGWVKEGV